MNGTHERMKQRVVDACEEVLQRQQFAESYRIFSSARNCCIQAMLRIGKREKFPILKRRSSKEVLRRLTFLSNVSLTLFVKRGSSLGLRSI